MAMVPLNIFVIFHEIQLKAYIKGTIAIYTKKEIKGIRDSFP